MDPRQFEHQMAEMNERLGALYRRATRQIGVNCWYMGNEESVAMWRGYAGLSTGVAVKSTYSRLRESFQGEGSVWIGTVKYIDPNTEPITLGQVLHALVHKRKASKYERELRAATALTDTSDEQDAGPGLAVPVNVDTLIDSVVVGPDQDEWSSQQSRRLSAP